MDSFCWRSLYLQPLAENEKHSFGSKKRSIGCNRKVKAGSSIREGITALSFAYGQDVGRPWERFGATGRVQAGSKWLMANDNSESLFRGDPFKARPIAIPVVGFPEPGVVAVNAVQKEFAFHGNPL
ncbi:MAG TPA: hypothetical protein VEF34_17730 [Syntrophobacteraceae bacterium]|nr:hypothetical protein [Syntrophobacteraceae bacterium]